MNNTYRNKFTLIAGCVAMFWVTQATLIRSPVLGSEVESTRNRFLLLDSRVVASVQNAKLTLGTVKKHSANPLFTEDKPWEKRFDNLYGNVIYDEEEKIYKCWYSPFTQDRSAKGKTMEERKTRYRPGPGRTMSICYATSKDGLTWVKPNLGLVDYKGSKANNIVWMGPHGAGVHKDPYETDPSRRYKMVMQGVDTSTSADGIHWAEAVHQKTIGGHGDTHNNAFWAPTLNKYVLITRAWAQVNSQGKNRRERVVSRSESPDFNNWTKAENVIVPDQYEQQPYAMPTFFHGGVYIGIIAVHHQPPVDRVWPELAWSTDTKVWHRVAEGTPFIPLSENLLDYDYGCLYTCANPIMLEDEIRIYYGASDYLHYGWRVGSLALATLRPDGFAGYQQQSPDQAAVIKTTAIPYAGQAIRVSADIEPGGSVKVSLIDQDGQVISTADTLVKTVTDGQLKLKQKIESNKIFLKFELINAKLYSFSLGNR